MVPKLCAESWEAIAFMASRLATRVKNVCHKFVSMSSGHGATPLGSTIFWLFSFSKYFDLTKVLDCSLLKTQLLFARWLLTKAKQWRKRLSLLPTHLLWVEMKWQYSFRTPPHHTISVCLSSSLISLSLISHKRFKAELLCCRRCRCWTPVPPLLSSTQQVSSSSKHLSLSLLPCFILPRAHCLSSRGGAWHEASRPRMRGCSGWATRTRRRPGGGRRWGTAGRGRRMPSLPRTRKVLLLPPSPSPLPIPWFRLGISRRPMLVWCRWLLGSRELRHSFWKLVVESPKKEQSWRRLWLVMVASCLLGSSAWWFWCQN